RVRTDFMVRAYAHFPEFQDNLSEHMRKRRLIGGLDYRFDVGATMASAESMNEACKRAKECVPYAIVQAIRELYSTTGMNVACNINKTTGQVLYERQQEILSEEADMCLVESVSVFTGMEGSCTVVYPELMAETAEIHMRVCDYHLCKVYLSDAPESGQGSVSCRCIDLSANAATEGIDDHSEVGSGATGELLLETMPENAITEKYIWYALS
ncbi:hypothetical protein, partial [Anaplasma phagocytophilum]|uniref:hypothetical protein n=1 Tax=Anaplasma phagocytophilum TaxID=948 RepID=UPI00201A34D5